VLRLLLLRGGGKVYCSEGFHALPARPFGEGRQIARYKAFGTEEVE
jgi:hypothetical protein